MMNTERAFLDTEGLPGRSWYGCMLFAPTPTYAAEVLPRVTIRWRAAIDAFSTETVSRLPRRSISPRRRSIRG